MKIKVYQNPEKIQGFNFQQGFAALMDEGGNITAATSGWTCNGEIFVYRPQPDRGWAGNWEGPETFPIDSVLDAIHDAEENAELEKALRYAAGKKLHISDGDIVFVDTVPGEKSHNGGEYGFYIRYSPIPEHLGIYRVATETTCDFDTCRTGYQGIRALTVSEYRRLRKASDKIEAAGSLY